MATPSNLYVIVYTVPSDPNERSRQYKTDKPGAILDKFQEINPKAEVLRIMQQSTGKFVYQKTGADSLKI